MKKYLIITWILAFSFAGIHAQMAIGDSLALVAFYDSTNGPNWTNNSNWLQPGQPVSTWYGISTNTSSDHVVLIQLAGNNLTGHLPAVMFDLPELELLYLYRNEISGTIPEEIGSLGNLKYLILESNHLTGEIPPQLGMLANLLTLDLIKNDLTGPIPVSLCNLVNLQGMDLGNNHLSGNIPSQIDNLTNLTYLYLQDNDLYDPIPPEIGNLTNLSVLALDSNHLSGPIPAQIGNLVNLTDLALEHNEFIGSIPNDICNLTYLITLYMGYNNLSGPLPSGLTSMPSLNNLKVQMNYFTFSDLESLLGNTFPYFEYSPQRQIPISPPDTAVTLGDDLLLDISDLAISDITATNNQYQWGKDGSFITSPGTSPILNLDDFEYSMEGFYYCRITNSDFPLLSLTTDSIAVWVETLPNDITIYNTRIDEYDVLEGLKIYPNPTSDYVILDFQDEIPGFGFELYNTFGTLLEKQEDCAGKIIHLENYPPGLFILKVQYNNYQIIKKLKKK